VHFRPGKLALVDDRCLLLDWSETVISHPFLALFPLLHGNWYSAAIDGSSGKILATKEQRQQVSEAYLQPFGEHASQEDLQRSLLTMLKIGAVWNLLRGIHRVKGLERNSPQYYRSVVGMQAGLKQFIHQYQVDRSMTDGLLTD
ncbi:MAG TPA: hypothetical protein VFG52_10695, partial [Xanthomonadales bacterium]|nr:hypothetical protein [Xanthomonadales bacterium]